MNNVCALLMHVRQNRAVFVCVCVIFRCDILTYYDSSSTQARMIVFGSNSQYYVVENYDQLSSLLQRPGNYMTKTKVMTIVATANTT